MNSARTLDSIEFRYRLPSSSCVYLRVLYVYDVSSATRWRWHPFPTVLLQLPIVLATNVAEDTLESLCFYASATGLLSFNSATRLLSFNLGHPFRLGLTPVAPEMNCVAGTMIFVSLDLRNSRACNS